MWNVELQMHLEGYTVCLLRQAVLGRVRKCARLYRPITELHGKNGKRQTLDKKFQTSREASSV